MRCFFMKKCILCQKDLYERITFKNIFRNHYYIHDHCEMVLNKDEIIAFPFMDKVIEIHVLFPMNHCDGDKEMLFLYYGECFFKDIDLGFTYIVIDYSLTDIDLILLAKFSDKGVKILTFFNEHIFDQ